MLKRISILFLVSCQLASSLSLKEAEEKALQTAPRLKAADFDWIAAGEQGEAQNALRWPRLSLESNYRYVSKIPQLSIGGGSPVIFGDNSNYSLGGNLSYTVFDAGSRYRMVESLRSLASARDEEKQSVRRTILAAVRTAYVRAQLAKQEAAVVLESYELSKSQSGEIAARFRAGSASRLDSLNAQREVGTYELKLSQSRAEEESANIDLLSLIGDKDLSVPSKGLKLDPLGAAAEAISSKPAARFTPEQHPVAAAQSALAQSAVHAASSASRSYWPSLQLQLRSSLDYPNGPVREQFNQNTIQVNLAMPVWDWGYTSSQVAQKRAEEQSAMARRENAVTELRRDHQKVLARLESLKEQKVTALKIVKQSESVARLVYQSYRAGRTSLVDVQASNLRALEAKLQLARVDASSLVQSISFRSLTSEGD